MTEKNNWEKEKQILTNILTQYCINHEKNFNPLAFELEKFTFGRIEKSSEYYYLEAIFTKNIGSMILSIPKGILIEIISYVVRRSWSKEKVVIERNLTEYERLAVGFYFTNVIKRSFNEVFEGEEFVEKLEHRPVVYGYEKMMIVHFNLKTSYINYPVCLYLHKESTKKLCKTYGIKSLFLKRG